MALLIDFSGNSDPLVTEPAQNQSANEAKPGLPIFAFQIHYYDHLGMLMYCYAAHSGSAGMYRAPPKGIYCISQKQSTTHELTSDIQPQRGRGILLPPSLKLCCN